MREIETIFDFGCGIRIIRRFTVDKGIMISFVIQLILTEDEQIHEIVRYDSWHNTPHKHILYKEAPSDLEMFEGYSNDEVYILAVQDLEANYEQYVTHFRETRRNPKKYGTKSI